jgi:hypothetical protein
MTLDFLITMRIGSASVPRTSSSCFKNPRARPCSSSARTFSLNSGGWTSLSRPTLLAIDEVGYLAYDANAADLLFQVVSRRYEQKSIVITTNLPFKQWDTVFPNAACAVALIDRLTHHAGIVSIDGQSYRKREAEQAQKRKQEQKPKR